MSDQTSPDAGAVVGEASNPEAEQANAATNPDLDTQADAGDETGEARTFTQQELNDIVKKEKARAEAKAERRVLKALERFNPQQAQEQRQPAQQAQDAKPTRRQGEDDDTYLDRLTDWKLDQRERAGNQQRAQEQTKSLEQKTEKLYADAAKIPGFDREDFNAVMADNSFSGEFAKALVDSDQAPKLMAYLAANPDDAARIATLSSARQAAEIGKLETRLSASTPRRASAPISPIGSRGASSTSDPEKMSQEQYEKWRAGHSRRA